VTDLIDPSLLRIEIIYLQTGTTEYPGGQHAGTPASKIRITHIPTDIVAECGVSRSNHKNKTIAIGMIEAALTGPYAKELL
jgi:peptide chain release factor 2